MILVLTAALGFFLAGAPAPQAACTALADDGDLASLVPGDASMVVGADVDAVAATPFWNEIEPALRADLGIGQALQVADRCGLALDRIYSLVGARNRGSGRVWVARGNQIGMEDPLVCVADQVRARSGGKVPWIAKQDGCLTTLEPTDSKDFAIFVVNRYTLVLARGEWIDPVRKRLQGSEALSLPKGLGNALAQADRGKSLWMVADIDDATRSQWPGMWAQEADQIAVDVKLDTGAHMQLGLHADNVASLASTRERLIGSILNLGERLAAHDVTLALSKNPTVRIDEKWVTAQLGISRSELLRLRDALKKSIVGRGLL